MLALAGLVGSIAAADAVNPSTVVPSLYLARARHPGALACFIAGVFAIYLAGGLVLALGPGPALMAALRHVGPTLEHAAEAAGGIALLVVGAIAWRRRGRDAAHDDRPPRSTRRGAALAAGAGISAIELPTAFLYFGAISAVLGARVAVPERVALVVLYNAIFVAPLLAILVVRLRAPTGAGRLVGLGDTLRRAAPVAMALIAVVAGATLSGMGIVGLLAPV